jgi:propionate catabolism operon transcriptional regulator
LFLDELGELPLAISRPSSCARSRPRPCSRVGADRPVAVDTRVMAATHRDLARDGRGQGVPLRPVLPAGGGARRAAGAARSRLDDLAPLIATFYAARGAEPAGAIDGDNLERLRRHAWPGNVRELRNVLERLRAAAEQAGVHPKSLERLVRRYRLRDG